jgi:alpha-N-arabinofuranosidase
LTSAKIQDHNTFDQANKVTAKEFKGIKTSKGQVKLEMPPFSIVVLELK